MNKSLSYRNGFLVLLVMLAGVALYWMSRDYEWVSETINLGFSPEAHRNDFLAAGEYLALEHETVRSSALFSVTDALPRRATLLLASADLLPSDDRVEAVLAWVAGGGRLIVGAANSSLLARLGLEVYQIANARDDYKRYYFAAGRDCACDRVETTGDDWYRDWGWPQRDAVADGPQADRERFETEDSATILNHSQNGRANVRIWSLSSSALRPLDGASTLAEPWQTWSDAQDRARLAHRPWQAGDVWLVADVSLWDNYGILYYDHAFLLSQLVPDTGEVIILHDSRDVGFWHRLLSHFPEALLALGVTLLVWLWSRLIRVGAIRDPENRHSRALADHIQAAARLTWQSTEPERLCLVAREALLQSLRLRCPGFERLSKARQCQLLTQLSGSSEAEVERALFNQKMPETPQSFVHFIHSLSNLRKAI